jgi:hypothetical protein
VTSIVGPLVVSLSLAGNAAAADQPPVPLAAGTLPRFRFFPAPPAVGTAAPIASLDPTKGQSLVRLPGDADSIFTLGGPGPSGEPRVRFAVEVNEASLKVLAPDPKVETSDTRPRPGGDWKPIDAAGRPYQLRFGARIIW